MMRSDHSFKCKHCDMEHIGIPDLGYDTPYHYSVLGESERAGAELTLDFCTIDNDHFIRGVLSIPIIGHEPEWFGIGVWVSLSAKNFKRCKELYDSEVPDEPPYFGWLSNHLIGLPETLSMKTNVVLQPAPSRPHV